jgi:two-component system OmpR family response regulator
MNLENLLPAWDLAKESFPNSISPPPHILLADDDYFLRQLEAEVLRCAGFEVDDVGDGAAAWDLLQRKHYDLLVTDNNMPLVFGVELLRRIQAAQMSLPVIMATGSLPDWEYTQNSFLQPLTMLFKPYTIAEFLGVVREKLRIKTGASADATSVSPQLQQPVQSLRL